MSKPDPDSPGGEGGRELVWLEAGRLLDALGHAVIATDLDGRVRWWNAAAERLYGWTAQEVLGRPIGEITVADVARSFGEEIMAALRQGRSWSGEFTVRRKDGTTFPALVTDTGVRDDQGTLVGIVGVSTDLGYALEPLLARSSDTALVLSQGVRISFVSPAAARLFNWTDETVLGRPLGDLVHPEDRAGVEEYQRRVMASPEPLPPLECRVGCGPRDCWCWVDVVMTDLREDPAVSGIVCNLHDVTERRADRDRLAELTEQLQTALNSRVVIEQAKGIVAAVRDVSITEAFQLLRRHARDHNLPLQTVAQAVIDGDRRL